MIVLGKRSAAPNGLCVLGKRLCAPAELLVLGATTVVANQAPTITGVSVTGRLATSMLLNATLADAESDAITAKYICKTSSAAPTQSEWDAASAFSSPQLVSSLSPQTAYNLWIFAADATHDTLTNGATVASTSAITPLATLAVNWSAYTSAGDYYFTSGILGGSGSNYRAHGTIVVTGGTVSYTTAVMQITDGSGWPGWGWYEVAQPPSGGMQTDPYSAVFDSGSLAFNGSNRVRIGIWVSAGDFRTMTASGTIYIDPA